MSSNDFIYYGQIILDAGHPNGARRIITYVRSDEDKSPTRRIGERRDLKSYPESIDWGNASAGAAQASLALLCHYLGSTLGDVAAGDREAFALHQRFKSDVIAKLPRDRNWSMTSADIAERLEVINEELAMARSQARAEAMAGERFDGLG